MCISSTLKDQLTYINDGLLSGVNKIGLIFNGNIDTSKNVYSVHIDPPINSRSIYFSVKIFIEFIDKLIFLNLKFLQKSHNDIFKILNLKILDFYKKFGRNSIFAKEVYPLSLRSTVLYPRLSSKVKARVFAYNVNKSNKSC